MTVTGSSGALSHSTAVITVRVVSSSLKVVLQFDAYDADDVLNGTSELEIDVNGQFAAYIPCTTVPGSCPAGVTGKYALYTQVWINGIQIDITKLVVPGTNTIVFRNPLSLHSSGVRNVQVIRNGQAVFSDPTRLATCISSCYDIGPGSTGSKLTETLTLASFSAASIGVTHIAGFPQQFAQTMLEVIIALLAIPALWRRTSERGPEKRSMAMRFLTRLLTSLKRPVWLEAIPS